METKKVWSDGENWSTLYIGDKTIAHMYKEGDGFAMCASVGHIRFCYDRIEMSDLEEAKAEAEKRLIEAFKKERKRVFDEYIDLASNLVTLIEERINK